MINRPSLLLAGLLLACNGSDKPDKERSQGATEQTESSRPASDAPSSSARPQQAEPEPEPAVTEFSAKTKDGDTSKIAVQAPKGWKIIKPPSRPDPDGGKFSLRQALKGLGGKGALLTEIDTSKGRFTCELYEKQTPNSVANFVGLARGLRHFYDMQAGDWAKRPYYDGSVFHRVIPGFMIQGGDYLKTGKGRLGYMIKDEVVPDLKHDRGGQLCMANRGPNTNEGQFFITERAAPHLDGSYTIFGQCEPAALVAQIARVPQGGPPGNTPLEPVEIKTVSFRRGKPVQSSPAPAGVPAGVIRRVD